MIPRILHTIWLGDEMPPNIRDWSRTMGAHHPGWTRIIWNADMLAVMGIDVEILKGRLGSWASVSNQVRLMVVSLFGGIYLDADCEVVRPIDALLIPRRLGLDAFTAQQDEVDGKPRFCNAVFGAKAGHPWLTWQLANIQRFANEDAAWGVYLMSDAPLDGVDVIPSEWCYPWRWDSPPEVRVVTADTLIVHHWLGSWVK